MFFHFLQRIVFCLQDLFAATYPSYAMVPGWQTRPPYGLGFNMQYNTAMVPIVLLHGHIISWCLPCIPKLPNR